MGSQWFLSYHSPDADLAGRLKMAIERNCAQSQVFFAPNRLRAGGFWTVQLAQAIAESTGFILLVGEHGVSDWQVLEYIEALDRRVKSRDFPIVVVLLSGQPAPGLPFLRQLHWVITSDPTSDVEIARLLAAGSADDSSPQELWRYTSPYRGLAAMCEKDSEYFFGRERESTEVLDTLVRSQNKLTLLLGNSGVGKSSLAQAGVLAALRRQALPGTSTRSWPSVLHNSRQWCFLAMRPGTEPVRSLVKAFLNTWQLNTTTTEMPEKCNQWVDGLQKGALALQDLFDRTEARHGELGLSRPAAFFLYVDQGEELYTQADESQQRRFSELVSASLADTRVKLLMSLRADLYGELQKDEALYDVHQAVSVPPLRETQLLDVVRRPAELLGARYATSDLAESIARRAAYESSRETGALPLLSYLLDDMWNEMVRRGDGVLRLPTKAIELGAVLVARAEAFLSQNVDRERTLRRILTLHMATVREDGEPIRRRAARSEFSDEEWMLVCALADYPNRLLVTATPEIGEPYAEVAHEAIFRHWGKLRDWIAAEREFLAWRTGLEAPRRAWRTTPPDSRNEALLMGAALTQAQHWLARRPKDLPLDREFIEQSVAHQTRVTRRTQYIRALVATLFFGLVLGALAWSNEALLREQWRWWSTIRPYRSTHIQPFVLSSATERFLRSADTFRECDGGCPEMVVIPAGQFLMGSPGTEEGRDISEQPQHLVTFRKPFAVSKFPVTFADWDVCVSHGDCNPQISDSRFGRGRHPVINITWNDARGYARWLSAMTGKRYRLLSEAEFEYAARAGTTTAYPWGSSVGTGHVKCKGCPDGESSATHLVGSSEANGFGLYDMHGNVDEWVEDCTHQNYEHAPTDGSAWTSSPCDSFVARGGSWAHPPEALRSANRASYWSDFRGPFIGFRIARELDR